MSKMPELPAPDWVRPRMAYPNMEPMEECAYYTAEQMRQIQLDVWRACAEACAVACDEMQQRWVSGVDEASMAPMPNDCAAACRRVGGEAE